MLFRYAGVIAINPNTETTEIVKSATGTVHLDENWDTPVEVHDVNGFAMTTLNTTVEGLFPDFYIEDQPVVGFKTSSGHRFYLRSSTPVPGPAGPPPSQVASLDGNFTFTYPDGTVVPGPSIPTPAALADQEIADLLGDEASATRAAIQAAGVGGVSDTDIAGLVGNVGTATEAAVAARVDAAKLYGLGPLYAGYTLRTALPVGIVTLGSSTTEGSDQAPTDRWVNKLIARMQAAYPSGLGSETGVGTLDTARRTVAGIHGYNGGLSGTTTANYLTDAKVAQIGALQPRAITHMVGSNDYAGQMPLTEYRANMVSWLDKLDAACPPPVVHILVHAHKRGGVTGANTYENYRDVLKDLAQQRTNCVFVDNEQAFNAAGVPDTDPLDLLKTDLVHLTPAGHDMLFRLMVDHLHVGPPVVTASAPAPATNTPTPGSVIASDSFSGADLADIAGRVTDNYLGGSLAKTWVCDPAGNVGTTAGHLVRKTSGAAFFAGLQMDVADHEIAFTLVTTPANDLMVTMRRALGAVAGSPDDYRFVIGVNGSAVLRKRVSGTETVLASLPTAGTFTAGSRIAVRATKDKIRVIHSGQIIAEVTDTSIAGPGWAGVSGVGTTTGWEIDNLTVSAVLS